MLPLCGPRELGAHVASFVLRRTQDLLVKHLPPLSQWVVFCKPSAMQVRQHSLQALTCYLSAAAALPLTEHDQALIAPPRKFSTRAPVLPSCLSAAFLSAAALARRRL